MYTGVQVLEPSVFAYLEHEGPFSITRLSYPAMLDAGEIIRGEPFDGAWITIGTEAELTVAKEFFDRGGSKRRWTTQSVER
jgi:NDP-sugar pyrophosphorylase family protein